MINHKNARRIADEWHGGKGTAIQAIASTGAIAALTAQALRDAAREADELFDAAIEFENFEGIDDLCALGQYLEHYSGKPW